MKHLLQPLLTAAGDGERGVCRDWLVCVCLGVSLGLSFAVSAAEVSKVYRWYDRDGAAVYSDSPPPRGTAHTVHLIRTAPGESAGTAESAPSAATDCKDSPAAETASAQREDVAEAQSRVLRTRQQMQAGREPLPGERVANAGGGSRLRPDYFARQDALESQWRQATKALDEARRHRAQSAGAERSVC